MHKYKKLIRDHWFGISVSLIIVLSIILRFYNYQDRWGLAYDQAHDALVARYALEAHKIPLLGPFSSAGPFQTGGEWYWFIMVGTALYPYWVLTPWIFLTVIHVVFVYLMIRLGEEFIDKGFGLILGLLASVSTAQIAQATSLTNQSPIAVISLLGIWSMIRFVRSKKIKYLFLLGFFISLAASIHLQGAVLISIAFFTIIFTGIPRGGGVLRLFIGLLLPMLPVIFADLNNNFFNFRNMIYYYLHDQYRISFDVLGRRWLTYALSFWPNAWAHVIGGKNIIVYIMLIVFGGVLVYKFFKKTISKEWLIILISFFSMVILLRYTRTPLFDSYIVFLHPFIFLLTGWIIYLLYKHKRVLGIIILVIFVGGSFNKDIAEIKNASNYTAVQARAWKNILLTKFPNRKFALYDYKYKTVDKSVPLVLFLDLNSRVDDSGMKVGMAIATRSSDFRYRIIAGDKVGYQILNLSSSTSAQLKDEGWVFVNPSAIYKSTEEWYK